MAAFVENPQSCVPFVMLMTVEKRPDWGPPMSFVNAEPAALAAAASDVAGIGSSISAANAAAVARTTNLVAAAQDEVSTAITALFGTHAQEFQALSGEAAAFHDQFVETLSGAADSYVGAEAENVTPLTTFFDDLNIADINIRNLVEDGYFDVVVDIAHEPRQYLIYNTAISSLTGAINITARNVELALDSTELASILNPDFDAIVVPDDFGELEQSIDTFLHLLRC